MEEWKDIAGFEGLYQVSNIGNVRSLNYNNIQGHVHEIQKCKDRGKYHIVVLYKNGKGYNRKVHRMVLEAFVGPCPEGMVTCHNNGIRTDNRVENLRWDTQAANLLDKIKHGKHQNGEQNPIAIFTDEQVLEIRRRILIVQSAATVANEYGVSRPSLFRAATGQTYSHLPDALIYDKSKKVWRKNDGISA